MFEFNPNNSLLIALMLAGIAYVALGWFWNRWKKGEAFDASKFFPTLGVIAVISISTWILTGTVPDFDQILLQVESFVTPTDPTVIQNVVFPGILTIFTWLMHNLVAKPINAKYGIIPTGKTRITFPDPEPAPVTNENFKKTGAPALAAAIAPVTAKAPIAKPIGLFKGGPSGAGGEIEPMTPAGIRHDFFQRLNEGIIYGLEINAGPEAPALDSMIIDVIYDIGKFGKSYILHDPHIDFTVEQVTDYPLDQAKRGIAWFCGAPVPRYSRFSKIGEHTVTVRVAPRQAPQGTGQLPPRDFSAAAGGVEETFKFRIYDESGPAIPADEDV